MQDRMVHATWFKHFNAMKRPRLPREGKSMSDRNFFHLRGVATGLILGLALTVAGCSKEKEPEPAAKDTAASQPAATTPPTAPESPTIGGDGSQIVLSTLSSDEIRKTELPGELGCGFSDTTGAVLLIAMGDAASKGPASGIVKVADSVERIAAPGGFDAMVKGVTFTGAGKTVRIELTGSPIDNSESPPIPAELIYQRADGAERTYAGRWSCGP